jgi:hypothetical protein
MTKEEVLRSINNLVKTLDEFTNDIVLARLARDDAKAAHVHWKMESIIVGVQQELTFLGDYIKENVQQ